MNKISKKIVALVTMAAFALTLVPAAAFATDNTPSVETSIYKTVDQNVEVSKNEPLETTFEISNVSGEAVADTELPDVYVWATEKGSDVPTAAATFKNESGQKLDAATDSELTNMYYSAQNTKDGKKLTVSFARTGEFTLHAGVVENANSESENVKVTELKYLEGYQTVTVTSGEVDSIVVDNATQKDDSQWTVNDEIFANNTAKNTVTVTAYCDSDTASKSIAVGKKFTISTNSSNISVTEDSVTTDRRGQFKVTYSAAKAGTYYIDLTSEDGYSAQLIVKATDNEKDYPASIKTSVDNAATLNIDSVENGTKLANAVQFEIKDQNGETMTGQSDIKAEPAAGNTNKGAKEDYVTLVSAPDKFKGDAADFTLVWDAEKEVYTLQYDGVATDLVAGEYTVRVALYNTGANADATFTLGKFDSKNVTELKVVPDKDKVEYTAKTVGFDVIAVDKNGVESDITNTDDYNIGIATVPSVKATLAAKGSLNLSVSDKDEAIGSKITLTVASEKYSKIETADITITDVGVAAGLAFDTTNGVANKDNTVKVSVIDENGDIVTNAKGDIMAYVADKSNEKANVSVTPGNKVKNGENGTLTIFADQETTVDVVVAVVDENSNKIYADTLQYTVGEADVNADKIVAMTIGSTDMIVNNELVNGDAAPYVADGRTMVPIRALSETFGAEVDYDNDAQTVTIVDGDTTIVMTIGETTYTVNGEEQTMDVAPVIGSGDRTYVPVRFVAEALGYKVTPLYAADNTTASVVFQK